jgi:single-strand DNA-binding protein
MNLNKIFVLGRMTADPQVRSTSTGQQVASFGVATNRVWYNQNREKQEEVEFHNVVVWGKQAEVADKFLKKGQLVLIEGRVQTRDWQGKDGQSRRTTEIIAERLQLGPRAGSGGAPPPSSTTPSVPKKKNEESNEVPTISVDDEEDVKEEDLPF